ncbi:hypothetical protein IJI72_02150 [Candidatus Saccharibacteria bacterium]|nr:hypothetical protein [Candidatus Saccharibacteria bacterium]
MNKPHKTQAPTSSPRLNPNTRNLLLLGLGACLITVLTTAVSLKVYHDSGDIYLDRSRPGFLPETEEAEAEKDDSDYAFSDSGVITQEVLDEYLSNLKAELNRLNDFSSDPFGEKLLSNDSLGI